ncbi:MAG TPA: hypothetical protein VIC25_03995 [Caulobacteraceae bacterium]
MVEPAGDRQGDADLGSIPVANEVDWIDGRIDHIAEQVADARRSDEGNEEIRAWPHSISAQCIAERAWMMAPAGAGRHVDHAGQTDGGVHHKARRGPAGARRPDLQHVVYRHLGFGEVGQDIVDGVPDRAGRQLVVDPGDGADEIAVEDLLDRKAAAIDVFKRIARRMGSGVRRGRRRYQRQRQRSPPRSGDIPAL